MLRGGTAPESGRFTQQNMPHASVLSSFLRKLAIPITQSNVAVRLCIMPYSSIPAWMRRFQAACSEVEVCERVYSCGGFNTSTLASGVLIRAEYVYSTKVLDFSRGGV